MKVTLFIMFVCAFQLVASTTKAQNALVELPSKSMTVGTLFVEIERQTDYLVVYSNQELDPNTIVTLKNRKAKVSDILDEVLEGTDLQYEHTNNYIVFSKKTDRTVSLKENEKRISGVVKDKNGLPIIGANVVEKGTTNGTITDIEGKFTLSVSGKSILIISYIGYRTEAVSVGEESFFNIQLEDDAKALSEVVVTALGIKREEKALGYAVQKVNPEALTIAKGVDVSSSLTGKVAGLTVKNSTEFNDVPSLKLRGETPLLIVDGVPYGNMSINDIASDDIESIDILKGATASALYGARGSSGAIMVTTKKGAANEGISVDVNSNTMFFSGYLAFPEVQHSYSAGTGGHYNNNAVWGDKLDIGRTAVMWDPYTYEMREQELVSKGKDNFKNFLQLSLVTNNNVSVSYKGKNGSFRTSLTHVYNRGQYPNQDLNKITFNVGGEMSYKKFKLEASASYNKRLSTNDIGAGYYSSSYIYDLVIWGGTEYDLRDYRNYWIAGKEHEQQNWYDKSWYDNPYFKAHEYIEPSENDIINAYFNTSYEITPWLKFMARAGLDSYSRKSTPRNAKSANYAYDKEGYFSTVRKTGYSINTDAMLMADYTWWDKFNINALFGGNIYYYADDYLSSSTSGGLSVPGFYSLNASVNPVKSSSTYKRKQVNSLYGKLSLSWASTYFLDVTGRNDWSSTLSKESRSYFYPSLAGSIVLSEIIPLPKAWEFWKIRSSWTTSKADADIYSNNNVYTVQTDVWDGLSTAAYPASLIGGIVNPQTSNAFEIGTAMNFFDNRLHFDFAYFRKLTKDFIISGGASGATGYNSIQINSKEELLRNGFEVVIGGTPIQTKDFQWDILTNWSRDRYTYHKIDPEFSDKQPYVQEGERWDWLAIYDWDRDPEGNIIHNGGIPVKQTFKTKVGNTNPDWVWGVTNTLRYKNWTLDFTIDGRIGGLSFSRTHQLLWNSGAHIDSDNQYRYDEVVNGKYTYVGEGVKVVSGEVNRDADGNVISDTRVFAPNDVVVSYEAYTSKYHDAASKPSRQNVLDETFFKLRNISITYDVPKAFCQKLRLQNAAISVTGQNLFLWAKEYRFADPDKGGDTSGYENLNSPSQRYIGFNLKMNF